MDNTPVNHSLTHSPVPAEKGRESGGDVDFKRINQRKRRDAMNTHAKKPAVQQVTTMMMRCGDDDDGWRRCASAGVPGRADRLKRVTGYVRPRQFARQHALRAFLGGLGGLGGREKACSASTSPQHRPAPPRPYCTPPSHHHTITKPDLRVQVLKKYCCMG